MRVLTYLLVVLCWFSCTICRDEEKILKACYWPNEMYEPCFGGCAEVTCDNPRSHLRPCYPYCEPGCVCAPPYVRDDRTHQCVLPHDCSPTQMGIPVPSKRGGVKQKLPNIPKYDVSRHSKRSELQEMLENESPSSNHLDEFRRPSEVSRMGNYFNIVIAPPPIKALQPRKLITNDPYRSSSNKRM